MNELELNKEYKYKQICEVLGWTYYTGGTAKQAQIREIEDAFEFKHPINKKTQREKKSYIFAKQLRELNKPKHGGVRNTKAIQPMMEFLAVKNEIDNITDDKYNSYTAWFCDRLNIFKKDAYNVPYSSDKVIQSFCEDHNISNARLFCEYISTAKSITKNLFRKALAAMKRQGKVEYEDGYMFTYKVAQRSKGHFNTAIFNDIIQQIETAVCNEMKNEYLLSEKLSGRQLLLVIYGDKKLKEEFDKKKLDILMKNHLDLLNKCVDEIDTCGRTYIDEGHPLMSYYPGIAVSNIDRLAVEDDAACYDDYNEKIANAIRKKTREALFKSKWTDEDGNVHLLYVMWKDGDDIRSIEESLFEHFDSYFITKEEGCLMTYEELAEYGFVYEEEAFENAAGEDSPEPEVVEADEDGSGIEAEDEEYDDEFLNELFPEADENEDNWRSLVERMKRYSA